MDSNRENVYSSRTVSSKNLTPADLHAWDRLHANQFPDGNAFLSSTFALAAGTTGANVRVCFIRNSEGLAAIIPYQYKGVAGYCLGAAERVGEELSDSFGVIARPDFYAEPNVLLTLLKCNYFSFSHLPEEQKIFGLSGQGVRTGLRIEMPDGGNSYWAKLVAEDKKFTSDTDRRLRNAERDFGKCRFSFQCENASQVLETLVAHKRAQYLRTGVHDLFAKHQRVRLLRALMTAASPDCQGVLSTLYFGDTWAAMHFGLKSRRTLHYWFPVYNPAFNSYAPGRLLLREVIRSAEAEGVAIIDRGEGESAAKKDFPSRTRYYFSDSWYHHNPTSWIYRAMQSIGWRVQGMQR